MKKFNVASTGKCVFLALAAAWAGLAVFLIAGSDLSWWGSLILCAAVGLILCAMTVLSFGALITVRVDEDRLTNSFFGIRVGTRLFTHPTAVYELYSPDGIRLYLDTGELTGIRRFLSRFMNLDAKAFALFYSVQQRLNRNGWTTPDLS